MWLCIATALAITPDELAIAAGEATDQLDICALEGCPAERGAEAAFLVAVHRYQDEGLADGVLAATVRHLNPTLFADLPEVLQSAATAPAVWAAPPAVPHAPDLTRGLPTEGTPDCATPIVSDRPARVMVLQWKGTDTRFDHAKVQRRVRAMLGHAELEFYPDVDLYQSGRADRVGDTAMLGSVPDGTIDLVVQAADETEAVPADTLSEAAWAERARALVELSDAVWFIDRPELRAPMFRLYAQIGRAADLGGLEEAPFRQAMGALGEVDTFPYRAAALAHRDPGLLATLSDQDLQASVAGWGEQIASAEPVTLSFAMPDRIFDPKAFASQYRVIVDGLEHIVTNADGLITVPPGRTDISLLRAEGYGLSERVEVGSLGPLVYFVRDAAQRAMGLDLLQQLMKNPNECSPVLDDTTRTHLALYQALHRDSDLYVVIPERGATARSRLHVWRWSPEEAQLAFVR